MRRLIVLVTLVSLFFGNPVAFSANSSIKNGTKCTKINATSIIGKTKFTCIKKSGKLIWNTSKNITAPQKTEIKLEPALIPEFSKTYTALRTGFVLVIANFDSLFNWECVSSLGLCSIDVYGKITGTGFEPNNKITVTLNTVRSGYETGTNSLTFIPNFIGITPIFQVETVKSYSRGAEVQISNFDSSWIWSGTSSSGDILINDTGKVVLSNLIPGAEVEIKVTANKTGFFSQSSSYKLSSLPEFKTLFQRDWQLIAKDPEGSKGQYVVIYGKITQFDTGTGLSAFRADVAGQDITSSGYWIGGDNSMLVGDQTMLKLFVTGDKFVAKVKILGTYSYTSTFSGKFTVPYLQVFEIRIF